MKHTLLAISATVLLSGCATILDATREEPFKNNPTERTTGTFIDDEVIEVKAAVNIAKASPALKQAHISVTSYDGVVLLTGQVPNEQERNLAGQVAAKLARVQSVHNELAISGPTSHIVRTNDAWITTKIKANMIADEKIDSTKVKVVTENGVVYLMGKVTAQTGDHAVNIVKSSHGVQKIVKVFEYIN